MSRRDFRDETQLHTRRSVRAVLIAVGLALTGLGIAGVVLPLLPGMPFLILAAACFARSSDRFYNWLLNHRLVGPPLHAWRRHRRIPRWVKPRAIAAVLLAFGLSAWLALDDPWLRAGWVAFGLAVAGFIAWIPSYEGPLPRTSSGDARR